ncbi:MAX gene-associated protein isoform X2 [Silurus meridionalis]|uniref:MAX gene-associated protein isoform X2 n=1 Tax=Silurus meridionalis TaxID=175797 RepID=UPI001EEB73FE|nr:MAX gene-associated protein isoform X2 [Silurus meridionalis]
MLEMEKLTEKASLTSISHSVSVVLKPFKMNECGINQANQQVTVSSVTPTIISTQDNYTSSNVQVTLENESVWSRFHSLGTEMILTKQGRRMFPCCRFRLSGLDLQKKYFLVMEIMPLDDFTHKWNGKRWEPVAVDVPNVLAQISVHPESPALGQQWMDSPVSFYKVKLTSDSIDQEDCVLLRPMRRYLPRLHIVPVDPESEKTVALNGPNVKIFSFPQTEFYAVTSYQNPQITQLKIDCNPFAMAFREDTQSIRLLKDKLGLCSSVGSPFQSPLLSLARGLGLKRKEGAVKSTASTCIQNNRKRDLYPGSVSLEEGEGIFTKIRNDTKLNCPNNIPLCQENTDYNKNNVHMAPLDVEPCVTETLEETLSSTDEPLPSISSTENPNISQTFEDAVNTQINDTHSESPTHFSVPEMNDAGSPPRSPYLNDSHVQVHKPGHLCRRKYNRRRRKAKAKWWSKTKYAKPLPAVVPLKAPLQPDLEDVEGMLFVSFVAKEALNIPVENREESEQAPPLLCPTHDQSENHESEDVSFSVNEKIATLEKSLLCHLKQQKHRQVIHPCLQDVGMKLSLLDLNSVIDLQYLGVHLPLPPPIHEDFDQINPMKLSSSPDAAGCFVSRTGKTNDPTKIKGWREKFQDNTVQNAQESFKNSSAFCSEMLDEYLKNEAQQISDRLAVFSKCSASPVSYQLPSKSSSYVVTLDSLLKNRSISANKVYSKPTGEILPKSPLKRSPSTAVPLSSAGFQQKLHGSREKGRKFVHSYQAHQHVVSKLPGRRSTRFVSKSSMRKQPGKSQLTWNSSAGTGRHLNSVQSRVISAKKGTMLQRIEEEAIFLGKVRTHVTTKRANFALTSLFNFQKPRRRRFPFYYKEKNACPKDVCLLGCICDSLAREIRGPTHCRRVECMFDCSCFKHKVLLLHPPKETANIQRGRKRAVLAFPIADPEREFRPPPPPSITTLWKRTEGNDDPEPLFVPASPIFSKNVSRQVQEEDKGFVYLYFESMMTCARVREYNSNPPPQIHMFPTKKEIKEPEQLNEIADANKPPSQTTPERNPAEPKPIKLLEILSECNWEPHRNLVLNALFRHMNSDLLYEPFCFGMYKIRLLSTTVKGADRCFTIMYKVCISRADEKEMTNDLQPQVKKTSRNQCLKKGFKNKVSKICETQTQKADTGSGQIRSALVETQQQKPSPHKRLLRDVPSLTHIAHDGHLRAVKSKPGIHTKGLIKVNGKTYNRAKLLLGQLGALHPVNRFAAFVTGRHLSVPQDQDKIVDEKGKACPPKAPRKPSLLTKVGNVSNQTPSNRVVGRPPLANAPGPNHASKNKGAIKTPLNATPKLVGKPPVVPDGSRFLLVPISPSNFVPAPSSETANSSTLPPGQQVVLQPAPGMPGSHFICQYNGQMIQLKPLSSGPVAQPSSVSEDSTSQIIQTANTSLPKETKSLQNPLTQMLPNHFPVIPPKVLSLSAKSGINIASGTPAFNLQSSFPGKTGMFSFRICPPTSEVKSVGSEHDGKPPDASVYSPTLALPGGFTLIKLFPPAVPAKVTSAASHRTELPQNHDSMTKSLSQNFSSSREQNCQVSESISSTFLPSNCNSAPQPTAEISQSSNDFPLEIANKDEPVEHFSESVHLEPSGKYDWVSEDAEMVHKNISKSEPTDDWPQNETERILWIDSDDEEENNGLNKEPKNLNVAPKSSAAEDPSEDACSKSSDVDQSQSSMSNHDLENACALNVNAKNNLNTANINKHEQTYNKTVANTKLSHISFGSSKMVEQDMIQGMNCPPVDIKNEPYSEPPEMDMSVNKLDFKNQDQVGHRTLCIGKIEAYSKQAGKNTLLDHFLTKDQKLFSHDEVTKHHIGSEDILPIMNKEETSISQRMEEFSSDLKKQGLGSKNSFQIRNHKENYSPVKTLASLHAGDSQENIDIALCPLLNSQTPVMNTPSTTHLLNTKQDLKEEKREMTIRTERFKSNTELRELSDDEDIVVDVINVSENEDEGPTDKFDRDTDTSSDDSEEDSDSDKEDSSSVSTSDSDTVGVSSEDDIDIESFEDSDVKIINTMKSQTRHKIDKRTTAKLTEQHCTSVFSTSICEQEKRQNHTEKERVRRSEMRQQFSALEKALNVDGRVRMCKHDILNQARLVIRALENRGHYLENKKKILHQRQSAYLSRILLLSGEKSGSGKDSACFEINCKQQTWSESTHSLQSSAPGPLVNLRRLDSDGNRLPPRLGCWKAPNYIRKRARKALLQPSVTTTVVADKNLDSPLSPDTQGSQTVSRPLPLDKTGMGSLPKIVLQSFGNTDAVKLMHDIRTPRPSSTEVSDPAELIKDCNLDLQNQNKEAEKCNATRDANVLNTPVSEHSNKESPILTSAIIESGVKTTSWELKKDEQVSVAEVKVRRKKRAKCDVVIDEDLSNSEVLGPRQLRQRTPVVGGATWGSIKKRRRRII